MNLEINPGVLKDKNLTPNQYFIAHLIHHRMKEEFTDYMKDSNEYLFKEDVYVLQRKGYLKHSTGDKGNKVIFKEAVIEGLFDNVKPKDTWEEFVIKFRDTFPEGVQSGGFYVKSSINDCGKKLKQFKKEYSEYDEEDILKATSNYIDRCRMNGFDKMKLAHYFIYKDKMSILASECEASKNGSGFNSSSLIGDGIDV